MEGNGTKRVELSNGQWAEIRTKFKVGDLKRQRQAQHDRGFEDAVLSNYELLFRLLSRWSFGDTINEEGFDDLDSEDANALLRAVNETEEEQGKASGPSSDGGTQGPASKKSVPSNG